MAEISSEAQLAKTEKWRSVFCSKAGQEVLEEMLIELGVFSSIDPKDEQRLALRNYGLVVMYNLGMLVDENIPKIIDNMLKMGYNSK